MNQLSVAELRKGMRVRVVCCVREGRKLVTKEVSGVFSEVSDSGCLWLDNIDGRRYARLVWNIVAIFED